MLKFESKRSFFITQGGKRWHGNKGVHRYSITFPRRLIAKEFVMNCERCEKDYLIWITDDKIWKRMPKDFHKISFCVPCFRKVYKLLKKEGLLKK